VQPEQPAVDPAIEEAYQRGLKDGNAIGRSELTAEMTEKQEAAAKKIGKIEAVARTYQGEADSLKAKIASMESVHAAQVKVLTDSLNEATVRVRKFLDGALSFSPDVMTWAEAMRACNGDYEKAAKQYPDLKKAFIEQENKKRK
jgi:hypothetical protein